MSEKKGFKECPFCGKEVEEGIIECPYCKRIFRLHVETKGVEESPSSVLVKKPRINIIAVAFGFILVASLLFYFYFQKEEKGNKSRSPVISEKEKSLVSARKNKAKESNDNYDFGSKNITLQGEQNLSKNISDRAMLPFPVNKNETGVLETGPNPENSSPEDIRIREKKRTEAYALYKKGISLEGKGRLDLAEKEIMASINIDPSIAWAHYGLGIIYLKKGMDDNAIKEFEEALKLDKKIAFAHYQIGKIYQKRENLEKAISEFRETVEIDSSFLWAHYRLAVIYKKIGSEELSRKEYEIYNSLKEEAGDIEE